MTDSAMKAKSPNGDGSWLPSARAASSSAIHGAQATAMRSASRRGALWSRGNHHYYFTRIFDLNLTGETE